MEPVLVTGAAGGVQGSTGRDVVRLLLARGQAVRAFVHRDDERAAGLRDLGAEVVVGDLREISSVLPAVRGVRRAYFTYPVTDGLLEATSAVAAAAREEGLDRVVEVSQLAASAHAGTPRMRQHWVAEQVFDWAGVGAVHLRAAVFFENLAVLLEEGNRRELVVPLGPRETVIPLVAANDVARVAASLLLDRGVEVDPIYWLTGQILNIGQVVDTFSAALGTEVKYVSPPPAAWARGARDKGLNPHAVEHLSKLWEIFRTLGEGTGFYHVTDAIEQVGGAPPQTLADFVGAWVGQDR